MDHHLSEPLASKQEDSRRLPLWWSIIGSLINGAPVLALLAFLILVPIYFGKPADGTYIIVYIIVAVVLMVLDCLFLLPKAFDIVDRFEARHWPQWTNEEILESMHVTHLRFVLLNPGEHPRQIRHLRSCVECRNRVFYMGDPELVERLSRLIKNDSISPPCG